MNEGETAPLNWITDFTSSQLKAFAYDPESGTLAIQFHTGAIYHYFDVPIATYEGLLAAESKGSFFIRNIKRAPFAYKRQN